LYRSSCNSIGTILTSFRWIDFGLSNMHIIYVTFVQCYLIFTAGLLIHCLLAVRIES
jgi:hypothetical protein